MSDAIALIRDRLNTNVPALTGRVEGAAAFAELMRQNALPQVTPAAFVIPLGLQGGAADVVAGLYRQEVREIVGVMLTLRSFSRTGEQALPELDQLIDAIVNAVAGYAPADAIGVFTVARGSIVSMSAGTLVYQLEFSLSDQLRIAT